MSRPSQRLYKEFGVRSGNPMSAALCPVTFAVDVILLEVGRTLSSYYVEGLRYPLAGPLRVVDWLDFMPLVISGREFVSSENHFKETLLHRLEQAVTSMNPLYMNMGMGMLSGETKWPRASDRECDCVEKFMGGLCRCMNLASHIQSLALSPGVNQERCLALCFELGWHLSDLCRSQEKLREVFKASAGCKRVSCHEPVVPSRADRRAAGLQDTGGACLGEHGRELRRRAAEGDRGQPVAVPVREREQGAQALCAQQRVCAGPQGSLAAGQEGLADTGPTRSREGTDFAFLSPPQGHWGQGHKGVWGGLAGSVP